MRRSAWWLVLLALTVHVQTLWGPLQFDDHATLAVDPGARSIPAWWSGLATHVRPLTKLSFALSASAGRLIGSEAFAHHLGNLLVHALAVVALDQMLRALLRSCVPGLTREAAARAAFGAAALYAVHPIVTEAVAYLSGRSMALGSLFVFAGLDGWIRGRRALAVGLLAAAVLARETMVAAALLVPLWEWARLDRPGPAFSAARLRTLGPAAATAAALLALAGAWLACTDRYAALLGLSLRIGADRLGAPSFLVALRHFAELIVLARYPNIDPDVAMTLPTAARLAGMALLASLGLAAWRSRRTRPELLIALLWACVFIAPLYAVQLRHDAIAERHFLPALAAAALLAGTTAARAGRTGTGLLVGAALLCTAVTLTRNADYRSEIALWEATARGSPNKVRVLNNLGAAYLDAQRWPQAEAVLRRALALDPGHALAAENLLQARTRQGPR